MIASGNGIDVLYFTLKLQALSSKESQEILSTFMLPYFCGLHVEKGTVEMDVKLKEACI